MLNKDMEFVDCNLCSGSSTTELYDFTPFKIVRCNHCGLIFVNPRLKEDVVLNLYKDSYFKNADFLSGREGTLYGYCNYEEHRSNVEKMYKKILEEIEGFQKPGSLLEIGSAYGFFLNIARQKGWDVSGIELSEEAADYSRIHFKIAPFVGTLSQYRLPSGKKHDVVVFFDVLEHLHDPTLALKLIHSLLSPNGIIVFAVPNSATWTFKLLGSKWEDLQRTRSNEHLFFFDKKTTEKILNKCQYMVLSAKTMGRFFDLKHLCDRLKIYNRKFFSLAGRAVVFLGLSDKNIYINPGLKLIVYAKKIPP